MMSRRGFLFSSVAALIVGPATSRTPRKIVDTLITRTNGWVQAGEYSGRWRMNAPNLQQTRKQSAVTQQLVEAYLRSTHEVRDMQQAPAHRASGTFPGIVASGPPQNDFYRFDFAEIERRVISRSPELLVFPIQTHSKEGET